MRTIRVTSVTKTLDSEISVETEIIIGEDEDVREAGAAALRVIRDFNEGMMSETDSE